MNQSGELNGVATTLGWEGGLQGGGQGRQVGFLVENKGMRI